MQIIIPYLPPRELSPNARCHWSVKHRASAQLKADAYFLALLQRMDAWSPILHPVVNVTFIVAQKRTRDRDNAMASLKSAIDGLEAAGIFFNDSLVKWGSIEWEVDKSRAPMTIIEVKDETSRL